MSGDSQPVPRFDMPRAKGTSDVANGLVQDQETSERVNAALEACGGDKELAAKQLGWTRDSVNKALRRDQRLYRRWVIPREKNWKDRTPTEMTDDQTLMRPERPIPALNGMSVDERRQWEIGQETTGVKGVLKKLKLSEAEQELAEYCAELHQHHLVASMQIVGGGGTRACIILQTQVDAAAKRLEGIRTELSKPDLTVDLRQAYANEEKIVGSLFIAASSELRQHYDASIRGLSLAAAIRERLDKPKGKPIGKPGFQQTGTDEPEDFGPP